MKNFSRYVLTAVAIIALCMTMSACSKSSSDSSAAATPTTTAQGAQAASGGTQGATLGSGSAETFNNLGNIGLSATTGAAPMKIAGAHATTDAGLSKSAKLSAKLAKSRAINKATSAIRKARALGVSAAVTETTVNCDDGGTVTWTGDWDADLGTFDLDIVADNCKEDGTKIDGQMGLKASITSSGTSTVSVDFTITQTLGTTSNKLTLLDFSDEAYSVLVAKLETALTMTLTGSVVEGVSGVLTYTANGTMDVLAYGIGAYAMTYTNFSFTATGTLASGTGTFEILVNGGFSESWTDMSVTPNVEKAVSVSFTNFKITDVWSSLTAFDETISGGFTIDFTPDECFEGAYTFETTTPIHYLLKPLAKKFTTNAGVVIINGVVTVTFNADGSITVTINGESAYDGSRYDLGEVCDFHTMNEETPDSSGTTGTSQGDTMTVTSTSSSSGSLNCYTDLHVNYYDVTNPTASATGTWYVDWHVNDNSTVPTGSGFEQYLDIDADGIADVGLDINGSATDDTSGGIEHFTANTLPVGYYVISMNNYSCASSGLQNDVSIQIGSSVFGPYTCTYTTSGEGTTAGAWCAIADVVVMSSGATVQAHDTSLQLWHDGFPSLGVAALKNARMMQ